jgi:hypothetical protein
VRTLDLPPANYHHESEYVFGAWVELWIVRQFDLAVRLRPGWIVQIGEGTVGREIATLQLDPGQLTPLTTKGKLRLAFRACLAPQ